ncbi:MAG: hypothetical protein JO354_06220 [Verrucomicrobia bacterium]|nr:hypothetical protein [Verrucomicrobiota bacterium]
MIFALALTHVFATASTLILERKRVRYSGLLTATMINSSLGVIVNWLFLWQLEDIKHWSVGEVLLQLSWVVPQYFTCSLLAMPCGDGELLHMPEFYERQRPVIYSAYLILFVMAMTENYADRHNLEGWKPNEWIGADLLVLVMFICSVVAGWAKPRWLQWLAIAAMILENAWFLVSYTIT